MPIDWKTIKKPSDIDKIKKEDLFDEYDSYSGGSTPPINPKLPDDDIEAAFQWLTVIPDLIGICLVIGEEGSGKTMLAHVLGYDSKYLFNKLVVLDRSPRPLFGRYVPFSTEFLQEQLARLDDMVTNNGRVMPDGRWVCSRGDVLIRRATIVMDEFGSRWMSRLDSPMIEPKKSLLKLFPLNRHLQALFLGVGTQLNDFDRHCFPHVDYIIQCTRVDPPPYDQEGSNIQIVGRIQKVKYRQDRDEFMPVGTPSIIAIEGSKPRHYLKGEAYKSLFHTDNVQAFPVSKSMKVKS